MDFLSLISKLSSPILIAFDIYSRSGIGQHTGGEQALDNWRTDSWCPCNGLYCIVFVALKCMNTLLTNNDVKSAVHNNVQGPLVWISDYVKYISK